jgi:two-component system, LytTR family, response regulator LytT
MNVLMIEQEKEIAQKIKELLSGIDESIHVVAVKDDMYAAAEWLDSNQVPDIILANTDVMAELEKKVNRDIKATVTFSTTTEAFNFHAFRYKTIRTILKDINGAGESDKVFSQKNISVGKTITVRSYKERFLVKQGQKLLSTPIDQIAYFFSDGRFIFFKTFDNQKFLLEYRIEQLEKLLPPDRFFRVNRTFVISLPTVKEIHAYFGNRLKLYLSPAADKEVIVSRKRVNDFKDWLGK